MVQMDLAFARLISNIHTELFQRRKSEQNKAIKKSSFADETVNMKEYTNSNFNAAATVWKWGPGGGASPFTDESPLQGVWGLGEWS